MPWRCLLAPGCCGAAVVQLLGLAAILIGFWLIGTYVVPNPNPAIRGQTFQMLQVVHFLWPPFLFGWLHRLRYTAVQSASTRSYTTWPIISSRHTPCAVCS